METNEVDDVPLSKRQSSKMPLPAVTEATEGGLVSNGSVSDGEMDQFWAPETAVEEEERLRKAREFDELGESVGQNDIAPTISQTDKFSKLERLLQQSEMYTNFLKEQMNEIEQQTEEEAKKSAEERVSTAAAAAAAAVAARPNKRRRKGKAVEPPSEEVAAVLNPTQELLPLMQGELRDYQLKGIKWMISLYQNGLNGILADQMGLGKTVQTIGFLSHLKMKGVPGPFLILAPLSTLQNWVNEFERFCPALPALLYHGNKKEREELRKKFLRVDKATNQPKEGTYPAIVTSYEILIADRPQLARTHWKYIVIDEGHRLKNFNCKLLRDLKTIPANNKLLLTGTPLQNNLGELWSLLNFLLPDIFNSLDNFESWFDFTGVTDQGGSTQGIIAAEQHNRMVSKLHSILKPFLLRRIKADVEINLPRKSEILMYAHMTEQQRQINQQLLEKSLAAELTRLAEQEGTLSGAAAAKVNNVLMQMRKNCNHPDLITSPFTNDTEYPSPEVLRQQCGKMDLLDRLLKRLHFGGHKVLIFSQMVKMLDLIESFLDQQGHRACRIDGSVAWQDRQAAIKAFNEDPNTWVFLLSTRAGGLGINLTAADTVIIYDSDWNPQQDLQAMDRAHRIGQQKPVLVLRLATANSVEGKMLKRAASKMALERVVIKKGVFKELQDNGDGTSIGLSAGELLDMLKPDFSNDDLAQSGVVSDEALDKILDRTHLVQGVAAPYPPVGPGYEVVRTGVEKETAGLLQGVE